MARKFALYLKDDHEVRNNIEEIRAYFDYGKMVEYFHDGSLQQWLDDRHYEAESIALSVLDGNAPDFREKLCYIFRVDSASIELNNIITDDEEIIKKKAVIRQYTTDNKVLDAIDNIATNQAELEQILERKPTQVYLCGSNFSIIPKGERIKYIGIGSITLEISRNDIAKFEKNKIIFENININVQNNDTSLKQATDVNPDEIVCRFMRRNGIEKDINRRENMDVDIALEILACLMNGKTKKGEYIWNTRSELVWPYTIKELKKLSIPQRESYYYEIQKWIDDSNEQIIFLLESEYSSGVTLPGLEFRNELLVLTEKSMYYYGEGKCDRCVYKDITNVTVPLSGIVNIHLKDGKNLYIDSRRTVSTAGDETIRFFLTIMGKMYGGIKGDISYSDRSIIRNISLECLNDEKLLSYLEKTIKQNNIKSIDGQYNENTDDCCEIDNEYNAFVSELFSRIMNVEDNLRDISSFHEFYSSFYDDMKTEMKMNKEKVLSLIKGYSSVLVVTNRAVRMPNGWTIKFTDIESISIRRTGRMDIYKKNGVIQIRKEYLSGWNTNDFRLFLLVMAKLYAHIEYCFTEKEFKILNGVFLSKSRSSLGEMITKIN